MRTAQFQLEPLTCPSCIKKIEGTLSKIDGVEEVKVLFNSSKVKVVLHEAQITPEKIQNTIEKLGYPVLSNKVA